MTALSSPFMKPSLFRFKNIFKSSIMFFLLLIFLICFGCTKKKPTNGGGPEPPAYPTICEFPAWSPDGSTIAYWYSGIIEVRESGGYSIDHNLRGIWFINPDGTNKQMFLQGGDLPDWSPDGQKLALVAESQIYTIKTDGDSLTQLTFGGRNFFPDWSPDGERIAYHRTDNPPDSSGIWVIDADGANKRHLFGLGGYPDWSPDGSQLVYINYSNNGNNVWIIDSSGTSQIQLTSLKDHDNRYPVFSPDGQSIAFSNQKSGEAPQVWIMNSDGSNLKWLTTLGGTTPCWSPDGTQIAYVRSNWREYSSE